MQSRHLLRLSFRATTTRLTDGSVQAFGMRFLYQSGLLAVQLLARDDRVAHTAEYQPAIFLFHLESAVEIVLRDGAANPEFCM